MFFKEGGESAEEVKPLRVGVGGGMGRFGPFGGEQEGTEEGGKDGGLRCRWGKSGFVIKHLAKGRQVVTNCLRWRDERALDMIIEEVVQAKLFGKVVVLIYEKVAEYDRIALRVG